MPDYLDKILSVLAKRRRIDVGDSRHNIFKRRLREWMSNHDINDVEAFYVSIQNNTFDIDPLIDWLLVKISFFFRNSIVFDIIANKMLFSIIKRKRELSQKELRIWCAGCSTGEETYSIAIILYEQLKLIDEDFSYFIFGTDLSENAVKSAKLGEFNKESVQEVKFKHLERFFTLDNGKYRIKSDIRTMARFSVHDLLSESQFAPAESIFASFDLVLCRNVLIYYAKENQISILDKLYKSLSNNGFLVLGESEQLPSVFSDRFRIYDPLHRIYQRID